jgi:hypothetical protein
MWDISRKSYKYSRAFARSVRVFCSKKKIVESSPLASGVQAVTVYDKLLSFEKWPTNVGKPRLALDARPSTVWFAKLGQTR